MHSVVCLYIYYNVSMKNLIDVIKKKKQIPDTAKWKTTNDVVYVHTATVRVKPNESLYIISQ